MKCNPRYLRKAKGKKRDPYLHILYNPPKSVRNFRKFAEKAAVLFHLIEFTNQHNHKDLMLNYPKGKLLNFGFTIYYSWHNYKPIMIKQIFIPEMRDYTMSLKQVTLDYYEVILLSQFVNT